MRRRLLFILFIMGVLIGLGVGLYFFYEHNHKREDLVLYGNVDVRLVDIGFRVPGQVTELFYEEGDLVEKGDLLARLDSSPYDNQVLQAAANVEATKVNLENAEKLVKRRKELIGIEGVSQEDLDDATENMESLKANLEAQNAELAIAKDNLSYTKAYAPTKGIILTRVREPGTVVKEADPVYTISVSSPVWIRAFVDESHLGDVYFGMQAEIHTDTENIGPYIGQVGFISPIAEFTPKTVETTRLRTDLVYRLRIYVDNPDGGLKQGMPVTVKLRLRSEKQEKSE